MALKDILLKATPKVAKSTEKTVAKFTLSNSKTPKIPQYERKFSKFFLPTVKIVEIKDSSTSFAAIRALISSNPHLKFIECTKCNLSNIKQFWFIDTSKDTKIVLSFQELHDRKKLGKRFGNGFDVKLHPERIDDEHYALNDYYKQ